MRVSLFLVLHFFSLFHSFTQIVLHFVKLCFSVLFWVFLFDFHSTTHFVTLHFSELRTISLFSLQLTVNFMLVLLGLFLFAFTVVHFAAWVVLKIDQLNAGRELTDMLRSTVFYHHYPPELVFVQDDPYLWIPMVSIFLSFIVLLWSWPTAWLIVQCSTFFFVTRSCILYRDFLCKSFVSNMSRFYKSLSLNKLLQSHTIGEWWLNLRTSVAILFFLPFSTFIVMRASLVLVSHFSSLFDSSIESVLHFLEFILFSFQAKIHFVRLCVSAFIFELFIFGYIKPHNL